MWVAKEQEEMGEGRFEIRGKKEFWGGGGGGGRGGVKEESNDWWGLNLQSPALNLHFWLVPVMHSGMGVVKQNFS